MVQYTLLPLAQCPLASLGDVINLERALWVRQNGAIGGANVHLSKQLHVLLEGGQVHLIVDVCGIVWTLERPSNKVLQNGRCPSHAGIGSKSICMAWFG